MERLNVDYEFASRALLAILLILVLATFQQYGLTWDEPNLMRYGQLIRSWYASGFVDTRYVSYSNLRLYGGAIPIINSLLGDLFEQSLGRYEATHLFNALVGIAGVAGAIKVGSALGGARCGFLSGLLLSLTPRYYGEIFNNSKDVPFAVFCVWSLYYLIRLQQRAIRTDWRNSWKLSAAMGLAMGVRIAGVYLLVVFALVAGGVVWREWRRGNREALLIQKLRVKLLAIPLISYAIMLSVWPWGLVAPVENVLFAFRGFSQFAWPNDVLFEGQYISGMAIPWSYPWVWILITTPLSVFLGLFCLLCFFAWRCFKDLTGCLSRTKPLLIVVAAVIIPLARVSLYPVTLYDGIRHLLFVVIPLTCLAAHGIENLLCALSGARGSAVILGALLAHAIWVVRELIILHPLEYIYFNELEGGLPGAFGKFDLEYSGLAYREGVECLPRLLADAKPVSIFGQVRGTPVELTDYFAQKQSGSFHSMDSPEQADFILTGLRWDEDRSRSEPTVAKVERFGVPLLYIKQNPSGATRVDSKGIFNCSE